MKKASPREEASQQSQANNTTKSISYYHYTTGQKLIQILESGFLLPSSKGGKPNELPLLWFSTATDFEPTSLKMMRSIDGTLYGLSRDQQRAIAGNVRLVLKQHTPLMRWNDACKSAGISNKDRRAMEFHGREMGGNPKCWFATLDAVSVDLFDIEVDTGNKWVPIQDALEPEVLR